MSDVARALEAARKFSLPQDREIIHTLPQEFIVDSQRGIRQPAGMFGARLEARVHVVTASRPALDNLAKTLTARGHRAGRNRARAAGVRLQRYCRQKSATRRHGARHRRRNHRRPRGCGRRCGGERCHRARRQQHHERRRLRAADVAARGRAPQGRAWVRALDAASPRRCRAGVQWWRAADRAGSQDRSRAESSSPA